MMRYPAIVWTICILIVSMDQIAAQFYGYKSESAYEKSLEAVRFETVDLTELRKELESRRLCSSEVETNQLLTRNFKHIFFNQLNRSRFIVAPKPQTVVNRILNILELNRGIERLIEKGNRIDLQQESSIQMRNFIHEVKQKSEELNNSFADYFLEAQSSSYSLNLPARGNRQEVFLSYLRQSEKINRELDRSLERYFFNASPNAVSLSDYQISSISVLCKSLFTLSETYNRLLVAN